MENQIRTVNIKGKDYVEVSQRIKAFRSLAEYKGFALISEIISITDSSCIIKASVINPEGKVIATGYAQEDKQSSMINKTSFVENCETSAWGRALGNLGIGVDASICSAEEVSMAIAKQQMNTQPQQPRQQYQAPQQPQEQQQVQRPNRTISQERCNELIQLLPWLDPNAIARCCQLNIALEAVAAYKKVALTGLTMEMLNEAIYLKTGGKQ